MGEANEVAPGAPERFPRLDTQTQGRISELTVVVDLLRAGWQVYRNVANSGDPDLIIYEPSTRITKRVEVKTVQRTGHIQIKASQVEHTDLLAGVYPETGEVMYTDSVKNQKLFDPDAIPEFG
jgi:hypothetical protein